MKSLIILVIFAAALGTPDLAMSENRALIVGIGQGYVNYGISGIKGPEKDVLLAKKIARLMGFQEGEIKTLSDNDATREAILEGFQWVKEGVKKDGKALIYYSGHGSQVTDASGDENDGCDEVLVPVNGNSSAKFIVDDEIDNYLKGMGNAEIVFIVDSCFSGTITKDILGLSDEDAKYYGKGRPTCGQAVNNKSFAVVEDKGQTKGLVVLSATAQNEVALGDITGSGKGSLFTQAIYDTLQSEGSDISFRTLKEKAAKKIREICELQNRMPHTPQIDGNSDLFDRDIRFVKIEATRPSDGGVQGTADNAQLLDKIESNSMFNVIIKASRKQVPLGQNIEFTIIPTKDGYLNLMELDPKGNINIIFPNRFVSENRVRANSGIKVPRDIGGFKFQAMEPVGKSKLLAWVTEQPLNLYKNGSVGKTLGDFKSISSNEIGALKSMLTRSVVPVADDKEGREYGARSIILEVVR